VAGTAKFIFSI